MRLDKTLWALALAFYGVGDTVTTVLNLEAGLRELNPFVNIYSILFLKIFIFLTAFWIYRRYESLLVPLLLTVLGAYGTLNNLGKGI